MTWVAVGVTAISVVGSISKNAAADSATKSGNIINEADVWAKNLMRGANNELAAKRGSLRRYTQSVNNQRVMESGGKAAEAALVNYRRRRDAAINADLDTQIGLAEQAGAQEAAAGASGLTGGVADMVRSTTALRAARIQESARGALKQIDWDASKQQGAILRASLQAVDQSTIIDDIDYSQDLYTKQQSGTSDFMVLAGAAAAGAQAYGGRVSGGKDAYGATKGGQQSKMLAEQDSWFN